VSYIKVPHQHSPGMTKNTIKTPSRIADDLGKRLTLHLLNSLQRDTNIIIFLQFLNQPFLNGLGDKICILTDMTFSLCT
jgi:hypothetical protein